MILPSQVTRAPAGSSEPVVCNIVLCKKCCKEVILTYFKWKYDTYNLWDSDHVNKLAIHGLLKEGLVEREVYSGEADELYINPGWYRVMWTGVG